MSNNSEAVKRSRNKKKDLMIKSMGSKCILCGYIEPTGLVIHHINPELKTLSFNKVRSTNTSWSLIVPELRKCVLLCANCHNKVHAEGLHNYNFTSSFNEDFADIQTSTKGHLTSDIIHRYCLCGTKLTTKQLKYCCFACMSNDRKLKNCVVDWNSEILDIIYFKECDKLTFKQIGSIYGVSDNTIAKHYYNAIAE